MLYDVLPPLIFFASLGGIIVVVSRVVVRNRREQFVLELKNQAAALHESALHQPRRLASLIGPARKSFQILSNPFRLAKSTLFNTFLQSREVVARSRSLVVNWRENRAHKPAEPTSAQVPAGATETITPPSSRLRLFAGVMRRQLTQKTSATLHAIRSARPALSRRRQNLTPADSRPISPITISTPASQPSTRLKLINKNKETDQADTFAVAPPETQKDQNQRISRLFAKTKQSPQSTLEQAQSALASAQLDLVEELLIPYVIKNPRDAQAYMILGEAAVNREEWEDAIQAFQQVINLNPNIRASYVALGHAAFKAGKMTRAIEYLQRAHNNDPANRQVIEELLVIAQQMDNVPMQKSLQAELAQL